MALAYAKCSAAAVVALFAAVLGLCGPRSPLTVFTGTWLVTSVVSPPLVLCIVVGGCVLAALLVAASLFFTAVALAQVTNYAAVLKTFRWRWAQWTVAAALATLFLAALESAAYPPSLGEAEIVSAAAALLCNHSGAMESAVASAESAALGEGSGYTILGLDFGWLFVLYHSRWIWLGVRTASLGFFGALNLLTVKLVVLRVLILPASMPRFLQGYTFPEGRDEAMRANRERAMSLTHGDDDQPSWVELDVVTSDGMSIDSMAYVASVVESKEPKWVLWFLGNGGNYVEMLNELETYAETVRCILRCRGTARVVVTFVSLLPPQHLTRSLPPSSPLSRSRAPALSLARSLALLRCAQASVGIIAFNFRGIGNSEGVALGDADLVEDARSVFDAAAARFGCTEASVLFRGHSLGAAVATMLRASTAAHRAGALINDRSFSTLAAVPLSLVAKGSEKLPDFLRAALNAFFPWAIDTIGWTMNAKRAWHAVEGQKIVVFHRNDEIINFEHASLYRALKFDVVRADPASLIPSEGRGGRVIDPDDDPALVVTPEARPRCIRLTVPARYGSPHNLWQAPNRRALELDFVANVLGVTVHHQQHAEAAAAAAAAAAEGSSVVDPSIATIATQLTQMCGSAAGALAKARAIVEHLTPADD